MGKKISMTGTFTGGTTRGIGVSAGDRSVSRMTVILGGTAWSVAALQYAIVQVVVAAAWHHPPYSWLGNYISDLGNTACGPFKVPHGTPSYVCSPSHSAMNASFIIAGILTIAGAVWLRHFWPRSRGTTVALVLWVITGLGKIVVGLVPENTNIDLHLLAAFNVPVGCVAILLLSMPARQPNRAVGVTGIVLAVVGLAATALSTAAEFASSSSLDLGLRAGGMERVADYPGSLWILMIGIIAVLSAGTRAGHHAATRSR
jgi:hypothetical membrane protein